MQKKIFSTEMWDKLFHEPCFVLTSDIDWAPEWIIDIFFNSILKRNIPVHAFVTHQSDKIEQYRKSSDLITIGIHPNFLPNSTQGNNAEEIIQYCQSIAPGSNTFRCHAYFENSHILNLLYNTGHYYDSNLITYHQPNLFPLVHATGILRFPVFFEDDSFLIRSKPDLSLSPILNSLFSSGLKILNFHPLFVALNIPTIGFYNRIKPSVFQSLHMKNEYLNKGRGIKKLFDELIDIIIESGYHFKSFNYIIDECTRYISNDRPSHLHGEIKYLS